MTLIALVLPAYLLGSISFGVLASRFFQLPDPRTYGSGNPGATNVLRSGKKSAAIFTLLGDAGKGWLAVALAEYYAPFLGLGNEAVAAAALAVFLGHLFPVFLHFRGGKGGGNRAGNTAGIQSRNGVACGRNLARSSGDLAFFIAGSNSRSRPGAILCLIFSQLRSAHPCCFHHVPAAHLAA